MLTAILLATPLFGMSLTPPDLAALQLPTWQPVIAAPFLPQDDEWDDEWEEGDDGEDSAEEAESESGAASESAGEDESAEVAETSDADISTKEKGPRLSKDEYAAQVKERSELGDIHRVMGLATWGAMTGTLVLGTIQYYNLYGFGAGRDSNPCVEGGAVFGQGQCSGTPWLHLGGALLTTGLYSTTFALSLAMPDPNDLANGKGAYAEKVALHKTLRWVHFGGMIAQMLLGFVVANADTFGLDRTNDYGTLQALSTVHLGVGVVTWGAMTWAGALFTL